MASPASRHGRPACFTAAISAPGGRPRRRDNSCYEPAFGVGAQGMFRAVRDSLLNRGTLFRSHRLQRTGRLFLFEFVVVLLGVLAAQMLQGWVADRQSRRQASAAVAQLRVEAATMVSQAGFWRRSGPCLANH